MFSIMVTDFYLLVAITFFKAFLTQQRVWQFRAAPIISGFPQLFPDVLTVGNSALK
jgi:hypothetical protein